MSARLRIPLSVFKVNLKKIFAPTKNQLRQTAILHGLI
jgi:hypothetical protein